MIFEEPPRWLQRAVTLLLDVRDRETIAGDLLEEYREQQLPNVGCSRANFWYLRQLISIASIRISGGTFLKQLSILASLFILAAGTWLGIMENVLRHDGYVGRSGIAICIAVQGLSTLLFFLLNGGSAFRVVVMSGAAASLLLGSSAIFNILQAKHFEGFVLLIGAALILQGAFTLVTLLRIRYRTAA